MAGAIGNAFFSKLPLAEVLPFRRDIVAASGCTR